MQPKFLNLDADESIFFARELESVKSKSYDVLYPELKARKLIPVSFEAGPGAESITYQQYDQVGIAKIIAKYGDDLPRADVKGKEFNSPIKSLGASYGYSLQEIRNAKFAGKSLEQRRANAAKRAIMQKENTIAFFGDTNSNLPGLLSNANILVHTLPADGTGATTTFSTKTPDQIIRDLNAAAHKIVEQSKGVHAPDTLLLPIAQYTYCASTPRSSTSDTTILEYFLKNNPFVKNADWLNELDGAGTAGVDVGFFYKRDPDMLTLEVPQDFEQLPVQERGLEFIVPCHSRVGGTIVYYPFSVCKFEGC